MRSVLTSDLSLNGAALLFLLQKLQEFLMFYLAL
ncbi:hypothetical protein EMIT0324P_20201 [Pseudomonas chlororaphis]